ncbi:hypothetical protein D3C71_1063620 [compost metagenome]
MLHQAGFDFAELDTEPANLHLLVDAAEVLNHAIGTEPCEVAAAVQPRPRHERVRHKTFGSQVRTLVVTPRNALAAEVQLARHADRQWLQTTVQNVRAAVAHRAANRHERRVELGIRIRQPDQRRDHRFGRAVAVDQALGLQHLLNFVERMLGHAFTARGVGTDRQIAPGFAHVIGDLRQVARGETGDGDAVFFDFGAGALNAPQLVVARHHRRTEHQRCQPAFVGAVEADRGKLQFAVVRGHAVQLADRHAMHGQRTVGHADAFRSPGGARGVDQIGEVFAAGQVDRVAVRHGLQRFTVDFQHREAFRQRQFFPQPGLTDQQRNPAVVHQIAQAFSRVRRVERHIGATGLEDRQQADDHFRRTLHRQADPHFGADTAPAQVMGQTVGAAVEFVEAQFHIIEDQRRGVRSGNGLRLNQLMHAQRVFRDGERRVPRQQLLGALRCRQQVQFAQSSLRCRDHRRQQRGQMLAHARNRRAAEMAALVAPVQAQLTFSSGRQGQREVGAFMVLRDREAQSGRRTLLQGFGHREVFEHQQAVEQRLASTPGPALNVTEGGEFMFAQFEVLRLQTAQPLLDAFHRVRAADHRQGVDEQTELAFSPRQIHRTPGHCGAKRHAALAAVALQQQRPRALHQGVEGDFLLAGKVAEAFAGGDIERLAMVGKLRLRQVFAVAMGEALSQQRRVVEGCQLPAPESLVGLGILTLQPTDVVGETSGGRLHLLPGIALQDFAQQQRVTPAVEQQVMVGVDQLLTLVVQAHQRQAHQWRFGRVQLQAFAVDQLRQRFGLIVVTTPVKTGQWQLQMTMHQLHRRFETLREVETAAQDRMAVEHRLPRAAQTFGIETASLDAELVHIGTGR